MQSVDRRFRVLIVDDDEELLRDMGILLTPSFDVETSNSTREAMISIEASPPDCILLDINMPSYFGKDCATEGLALLDQLRDRFSTKQRKSPP